MNRLILKTAIATGMVAPIAAAIAGNALYPDVALRMNQGLTSNQGKYSLWMQSDGNLVMYRANGSVRWSAGRKGCYAIMQGDGNAPNGSPLWNIGSDTYLDGPRNPGDTVGRDLDLGPIGRVGHIGMWDGNYVIEAMFGLANAIRSVKIQDFKSASRYWGAASPDIPFGYTNEYCYNARCTTFDLYNTKARLPALRQQREPGRSKL